jgi:hypothetical protein
MFHLLCVVGTWVVFVTLGFEDEAVKLEEDNGNDAGVAPRRMLTDRVAMVY